MRRYILLLVVLGATGLVDAKPVNILMVGNSYTKRSWTYFRDFLDADTNLEAAITVHAFGGKKLFEYVADDQLASLLKGAEQWDFVILQEQSQLPAFAFNPDSPDVATNRAAFDAGGPKLIALIRQCQPQATIILFETWARHRDSDKANTLAHFENNPDVMMKRLAEAYRYLVRSPAPGGWDHSGHVRIAPVGEAFQAWYAIHGYDDASKKLQVSDNSHPAPLGSYLVGAVLYETCSGTKSSDLSYDAGLEKSLADELKQVGGRAVAAEQAREKGAVL